MKTAIKTKPLFAFTILLLVIASIGAFAQPYGKAYGEQYKEEYQEETAMKEEVKEQLEEKQYENKDKYEKTTATGKNIEAQKITAQQKIMAKKLLKKRIKERGDKNNTTAQLVRENPAVNIKLYSGNGFIENNKEGYSINIIAKSFPLTNQEKQEIPFTEGKPLSIEEAVKDIETTHSITIEDKQRIWVARLFIYRKPMKKYLMYGFEKNNIIYFIIYDTNKEEVVGKSKVERTIYKALEIWRGKLIVNNEEWELTAFSDKRPIFVAKEAVKLGEAVPVQGGEKTIQVVKVEKPKFLGIPIKWAREKAKIRVTTEKGKVKEMYVPLNKESIVEGIKIKPTLINKTNIALNIEEKQEIQNTKE